MTIRPRARSRFIAAATGALVIASLVFAPAAQAEETDQDADRAATQTSSEALEPAAQAEADADAASGGAETAGEDAESPSGDAATETGDASEPGETGSDTVDDEPATVDPDGDGGADPGDTEDPGDDETAVETKLVLEVSKAQIDAGKEITLTARIDPADATGTVAFSTSTGALGDPVELKDGSAKLTTAGLAVGVHQITARFTPAEDAEFASSESEPVAVTVIGQASVAKATLKWGVRQTFRSYIYTFDAFEGYTMLLGNVKDGSPGFTESQKRDITFTNGAVSHESEARKWYKNNYANLSYGWSGGSGTAWTDGRKANVSFGAGNGIHFLSHPMNVPGEDERVYALDLQFTNPRIELSSATKGVLYFDVKSRLFKGMTEVSDEFFAQDDVAFADLTLGSPTADGNTLTWSNVGTTLREDGYLAFGGEGMGYPAGTALDPLSFSLPLDAMANSKTQTKTAISASSEKLEVGQSVKLTASVNPKIDGTVTFSYGNTQIGKAVAVKNGTASLSTAKLPVGIHRVTAVFAPKDSETYGGSFGSTQITVLSKQDGGSTTPGGNSGVTTGSGEAAGSLSWGVSSKFIAYTTCKNKEAYGMSHCATNGSIVTNGVGSGWLFPQAAGSSWNKENQTGTVQYSGSVVFNGYGQKMFQAVNPSITVTSATSATLNTHNDTPYGAASYPVDLSTAQKTVGPNGEVTWSGAAVSGSLVSGGGNKDSITLEPITFTVGSVNNASFTATQDSKKKNSYTAAPTAPATTGVTVLTDPEKIRAGGRIEIEASGFDPEDNGVLVVLYSDPLVLDETATADKSGVVHWSGTLPEDVKGQHTITIQGSKNAGAIIDIHEAKDKKSAKNAKAAAEERLTAEAIAEQEARAAGLLGSSGMALWEWWASAGGLVAIAACMTLLTTRQRRR